MDETPNECLDTLESLRQQLAVLQAELETVRQRNYHLEMQASLNSHVAPHPLCQSTLDAIPFALDIYTTDGTMVARNRQHVYLFGSSDEYMIGQYNVLHDERSISNGYAHGFQRILHGEASIINVPLINYDTGTVSASEDELHHIWVEVTLFGIYEDDGTLSHIASLSRNITAHVAQHQALEEARQQAIEMSAELQRSQTLLQGVLDHLPSGIAVCDAYGRYLLSNQTHAGFFDKRPDEIVGVTIPDLLPPDMVEAQSAALNKVMDTNTMLRQEYTLSFAGNDHIFLSIYFPITDESGAIYAVGFIATDVTEYRAQEQHLRHAQFTLDHAIDSIFWIDLDGNFTYVNQAACRNLGYTYEELCTMGVPDIDPVFNRDMVRRATAQIVEYGHLAFETNHQRKDGTKFPVHILAQHIQFDDTEYICIFCRDISDRKRIEEEMQEQARALSIAHERLEQTFAGIPLGVLEFDTDGILQRWNESAERTFGWRADEVIGIKHFSIVLPNVENDPGNVRTQVEDLVAAMFRGQQSTTSRNENITKDGRIITCQWYNSLLRDVDGSITGILCMFQDLSEQIRAEEERAALKDQVIAAQQAAIRELSTPLLPIAHEVIALPVVGSIDSLRAQQIMETLLEGIAEHHAHTAIVDITGVRIVDTQVAQAFIQAAQAVKLLGAQVIITGIQPAIAQTLVELGANLEGIITRNTLRAGIAYALDQVDRHR